MDLSLIAPANTTAVITVAPTPARVLRVRPRFFWSPPLFWTSLGGLYAQFNSLYINGLGPRRCRKAWTVHYEKCTPAQLKSFVKQRGIIDPYPTGLTLKYFYIKLLVAADRYPRRFRFLDLPIG